MTRDDPASEAGRRGDRRLRSVVGVVVVAALLAGGAISLAMRRRPDGPATVVSQFLEARRERDCERLLGLVSRDSWSDGGELTRQEFLHACPGVVDGYQPPDPADEPGGNHDVRVEGDTAVVELTREPGDRGRLVREAGEWKIVTEGQFHLGRTPYQTILGYVEAYADRDCEGLVDFVSEATWSAGGRSRDEYVGQCAATMPEQDEAPTVEPGLEEWDDPVEATDEVTFEVRSDVTHPQLSSYSFREEMHLVEDELEWKLNATGGLGGRMDTVASAEVLGALVDEIPDLGGDSETVNVDVEDLQGTASADDHEYQADDSAEALRGSGFVASAAAWFRATVPEGASADVTLWQFGTVDGARRYADRLIELSRARRPSAQEVAVPGIDGARGLSVPVTYGEVTAYAVAIHDEVVVAVDYFRLEPDPVEPEQGDGLNRAAEILQAQIEELDDGRG